MTTSIENYLNALKKELAGADRAIVQDALADAEEYLRTALESAGEQGTAEGNALEEIMDKYGSPAEVAAAYRENEVFAARRYVPAVTRQAEPEPAEPPAPPDTRPWYRKFIGIYADQKAWGALLYCIFALATGIAYFTWVVTGISVSGGMLVLIVGIPIAVLFLFSIRGLALLEGKIVEALLGVRMPRRQLFTRSDLSFMGKLKNMLTQRQTWTTMIYMVLHLGVGIALFSIVVALISVSLWLIGRPLFELGFDLPVMNTGRYDYFTAAWAMPFVMIGGALLLTATLHLVKFLGQLQGKFAKVMLVRE